MVSTQNGQYTGRECEASNGGSLEHELSSLVGPPLELVVSRFTDDFSNDERFNRAHAAFHRIVADLTDEEGVPISQRAARRLEKIEDAFKRYIQAFVLHFDGVSGLEISRRLESPAAKDWVVRDIMPIDLLRSDPQHRDKVSKPVSIPQGFSEDFAYLLGAYAGTVRVTSKRFTVTFASREREPLERLIAALDGGCGIQAGLFSSAARSVRYFQSYLTSRLLVRHLNDITDGNQHLAWEHLQSSRERRAFLTGFFDFAGGTASAENGRFRIFRENNPDLIRDVAVLLKREGVYARFEGMPHPLLKIDDRTDVQKLEALGVVRTKKLGIPVAEISNAYHRSRTFTPEQYEEFIEFAQRSPDFPDISSRKITREFQAGDSGTRLGRSTVEHWLAGDEPGSMARLKVLEQAERSIFSSEQRSRVAKMLFSRLQEENFYPVKVVAAIADWFGSARALSLESGVAPERLKRLLEQREFPGVQEYVKILGSVGVEFSEELKRAYAAPTARKVQSWLSKRELEVFANYHGSVMQTVREAHLSGEDAKAAAMEKIEKLIHSQESRRRGVCGW